MRPSPPCRAPSVLRPGDPVQLPRILVRLLPGGRGEDLRRRPAPGLAPERACTPSCASSPTWRRRPRRRPPSTATPRAAHLERAATAGSTLAYEIADTVRRARARAWACASRAAAPTLTPFSGTYLYRDPRRRRARVHRLRDRPPLPDHRARRRRGRRRSARRRSAAPNAALDLPGDGGRGRSRSRSSTTARAPYRADGDLRRGAPRRARRRVRRVRRRGRAVARRRDTPAAELAAYVLWSATVRPAGFVARPGRADVQALDGQGVELGPLLQRPRPGRRPARSWPGTSSSCPFDHQDAAGALPDSVTHSEVLYNFVKPPIHGWALRQLRQRCPRRSTAAELTEAYRPAGALDRRSGSTARRAPGHDLPHYQHGNDSGWDNATTFDPERVVETADLAAFLVLQLRELADLAAELGRGRGRRAGRAHGRRACATALLDRAVDRRPVRRPRRVDRRAPRPAPACST